MQVLKKYMGKTLVSKKKCSRSICNSFTLVMEDSEEYRKYLKMTPEQFDILLNLVTLHITKNGYTNGNICTSMYQTRRRNYLLYLELSQLHDYLFTLVEYFKMSV